MAQSDILAHDYRYEMNPKHTLIASGLKLLSRAVIPSRVKPCRSGALS